LQRLACLELQMMHTKRISSPSRLCLKWVEL
jgi:hypothetical protein